MSSWSSSDAYTSAPLWALLQVNKAPTLANMGPVDSAAVDLLFKNEEADDFITGVTVGLFNIASGEVFSGCHQGWVLKTTGTGGRASRVVGETLVALTSNS